MSSSTASDHNLLVPNLSYIANSVVLRCSRILGLSVEQLLQCFETELPNFLHRVSNYARNLVEYCSYRALRSETPRSDHLSDKEFRLLTYDMMLAWEAPDIESDASQDDNVYVNPIELNDDDEGSLFYAGVTRTASLVDGKKTVGYEAFARIATACPAVADPITVHNLFYALTSSLGGRLHFLIYDKYLRSLYKVLTDTKHRSKGMKSCYLADDEIVLDTDGVIPTKSVVQHIGISAWPGRLTMTNQALYFEALGIGSYKKAVVYDLSKDLKQSIKRESTGPWGARLFDNAVLYKSNAVTEPIFFEFPQFNGQGRRDYWFEIMREVLNAHKFIRKFNLRGLQKTEVLSKASLGIFRYQAIREAFHITPSNFKSTLAFNVGEKLPKGDNILEVLHNQLDLMENRFTSHGVLVGSSNKRTHCGFFPESFYTLTRMGILSLNTDDNPEENLLLSSNAHVGELNPLQMAVKESVCYSGRVEAARATLDQVKLEDIKTNAIVIKELLFPLEQIGKFVRSLFTWEDSLKSTLFLVYGLYLLYRGWIHYILPSLFFSIAACMFWFKHQNKGKPIEVYLIKPPPNKSTVEQLLSLQDVVSRLETNIQTGTIALLKLRAILFAAIPQTTKKVAIFIIILAISFAVMPLRHLVLLVILEAYTRHMPLRKESSEKLIRRIREWWGRIPAAPVQLVRPQVYRKSWSRKKSKNLKNKEAATLKQA